jgi:hypothetical protein
MAERYAIPQHILEREAAKRSDRVIQFVCAALAGACLVGAAWLLGSINQTRKTRQLALDPETVQGLPPDIALLTKMGTFRALAIDIGFIRAERLKNEDKFFELMQLSSWLCKLAPRYPSVWSYAAWNEAYNISVTQYSPEARWQWVSNGIHLLRDQGIPYNPKSIGLYKELAWIYWHKIGDFTDDHHWSYRKELAVEMERVLGAPAIALTEQESIAAFRAIAQAPRNIEALLRDDPQVAALVANLRQVGLDADDSLLDFVARYLRNDIQVASLLKIDPNDVAQQQLLARTKLLADPAHAAARDRLLAALRAEVLENRLHLDPTYMLELMEQYGPIDWRLPDAQGLYWASLGDQRTRGLLSLDPSDSMNTVRLIFNSLINMTQRGRLVLEPNFDKPNASYLQLLPDHRFIRHTHQAFLNYGQEQLGDHAAEGDEGYPILRNYRAGHVNFLRAAVQELWWLGTPQARAEATEYFQWLRGHDREPNGDPKAYYLQPIDTAVMTDLYDRLTTLRNALMNINDFLSSSVNQLAIGDLPAAQGYLNVARQAWEYYMADKKNDVEERRKLPSLEVMRHRAAMDYLQSPAVPLLKKVRLWRHLDLETRQDCYDTVLPYMTRLCAAHIPPLELSEVFREPPGMDEFRKQLQAESKSAVPKIEEGEKPPK